MNKAIAVLVFLLMALVTVYSAAADITMSPTTIDFKGDYGNTLTKSIIVKNTGTTAQTGLTFSTTGLSDFTFSYSADAFDLAAGANRTIVISTTLPEDLNPVKYTGKTLLSNSAFNKSIATSVDLSAAETLVISKVKIESDTLSYGATSSSVNILDEINMAITVKNNRPDNDNKIQDISVKITVDGLDSNRDDLEDESDSFDLDGNGDDKIVQFTFPVPVETDEGKHSILIEVQGDDEDGKTYTVTWEGYLKVNKDNDLLRITDFSVVPEQTTCTQSYAEIYATATNLGSNDQKDTVLQVRNSALGIDQKSNFEMSSDPDDSSFEVDKTFQVNIPAGVAPGTYTIDLYLYYDVSKQIDHQTVTLTVPDCRATTTTTVPHITATTMPGASQGQGVTPGISYSTEGSGLNDSMLYSVLLIALIVGAVIGIIIMLVHLVKMF
jgi:hypothetical protein